MIIVPLSKFQSRKLYKFLSRNGIVEPDLSLWCMIETVCDNNTTRSFVSPRNREGVTTRCPSKPDVLSFMQSQLAGT